MLTAVAPLLLLLCCSYWVIRQLDAVAPPRWMGIVVGIIGSLLISLLVLLVWLY